jgi:hypothetical protein
MNTGRLRHLTELASQSIAVSDTLKALVNIMHVMYPTMCDNGHEDGMFHRDMESLIFVLIIEMIKLSLLRGSESFAGM